MAAKKAAAAAAEASAEQVTGRERARGGDLIIVLPSSVKKGKRKTGKKALYFTTDSKGQ